eukprot:COSAG01_NODE_5550_length_4190_cov_48.559276_8_plen_195_part_00
MSAHPASSSDHGCVCLQSGLTSAGGGGGLAGEIHYRCLNRRPDESPWLQCTRACQRSDPPPRLNNSLFGATGAAAGASPSTRGAAAGSDGGLHTDMMLMISTPCCAYAPACSTAISCGADGSASSPWHDHHIVRWRGEPYPPRWIRSMYIYQSCAVLGMWWFGTQAPAVPRWWSRAWASGRCDGTSRGMRSLAS